jgi:hypothetical protein
LLAATGGALIGSPPFIYQNGQMSCDDSENPSNCGTRNGPDWAACATQTMIQIPSQGSPVAQPTPTVTDMHNKPCLAPGGACNYLNPSQSDTTTADLDTFNAVWDFLTYRNLTGNLVMFGETWSNSGAQCNGYPDANLTTLMVNAYAQSCLYSPQNPGCASGGNPASVVFRPWGNATPPNSICETPLPIGAPNGPFKHQ